jgi:excisionase family DNA binding protein
MPLTTLTLAEAAQATGLNRSTILRAIKSGKISGARDETGAWAVEPVELHRVFPPAEATPRAVPQDAQTDALVLELRAQLAEMRSQIAEMRSQRNAWQGIAERLALSAPKPPDPQPKPAEGKRPWWKRLAG